MNHHLPTQRGDRARRVRLLVNADRERTRAGENMMHSSRPGKHRRSNADLAALVARLGEAAVTDTIICVTEGGKFARQRAQLDKPLRLVAAPVNQDNLPSPNGYRLLPSPRRRLFVIPF